MPRISATEEAALNAGSADGFDRDIFSGTPSLAALRGKYSANKLTAAEQSFMDNEVEELCEMIDDYKISRDRDLSKPVWDYIREKKFFGMIIPEAFGGLGFSAHGHSQVVQKIATRSADVAVTVMVPNSLGPGELLMRYGTDAQRQDYLPRLATGDIIPCFGLTGPPSGSDAAAMRDGGIVERRESDGALGVRANFKKRYITLAPVAGVVGLAIVVKDPHKLLGGKGDEGITVCLLDRDHPGLRIGDRHDPLAASFMNGTVEGEDVFIPLDQVIGGQERTGFGWNMLMDCLTEGRGISLPALSVAASKGTLASVGAYSRVRKQFKVPLAELEGVQEHLARIGGETYIVTAGQQLTNAMLNMHEQPPVITAILKQQATDRMRRVINDGMDVAGGSGICKGPSNYLAPAYQLVPIGITVEGANTLTRTLIQYGQGLMRSHPHLLDLVRSIQAGNDMKGFNSHLASLIGHAVTNTFRSTTRALTRSRSGGARGGETALAHYESQLSRLSAAFAFCADVSLTLGGTIKFKEMLSGRYADVLSSIYLGYAVLWYHAQHKDVEGADKFLEYAMSELLRDSEDALHGIFANFPLRPLGWVMQAVTFPTGRCYSQPANDKLKREVAQLVSTESAIRDVLMESTFVSRDPSDRVALTLAALPKAIAADALLATLRKERRAATADEQALIDDAEAAREVIIQVDSFPRLGAEISQPAAWTAEDRPALDALASSARSDQQFA